MARPHLSRNVRVVSVVSFFQDTASEMLYPILPIFVTVVLGAPPAAVGLIEGLADGTASAMKAVSGRLADLRRRRPLIAAGYGISGASKPIIGFAQGWPLVLVARFTDRMGKGLRGPPRDALITDESTPQTRGRAFGFHRMADTAGAVVGPLLGLGLYNLLGGTVDDLRQLFFLAAIPASLSFALVFAIREHAHPKSLPAAATASGEPAQEHHATRDALRRLPLNYRKVVAVLVAFSVVNFSDALLLLRASELGLGVSGVVMAYVLYNLVYAGLSYPAGAWSDRLSRHAVVAVGLGVFAVAYVGLGLITTSAWVWVLLPLYGAYTALTDGVGRAWIADLTPDDLRGTGLGLHAALTGLGVFAAGIWAGLAWGGDGRTPLCVAGVIAAALAVVLAFVGGRLEPVADS